MRPIRGHRVAPVRARASHRRPIAAPIVGDFIGSPSYIIIPTDHRNTMSEGASAGEFDLWNQRIQQLAELHRDVQRRALGLPVFSIIPYLICIWNSLKCAVFIDIDLLLLIPILIPMYLVVFIRNRFPGRKWRYRSFSKQYLAYAIRWLWRGETPAPASIVVRRLVIRSLNQHFRTRFRLLRDRLMLEERLTSQERDQVVLRIDQVLDGLGGRGIPGWYAYILPTASFLLSAFNFFHLQASSPPAAILGYTVMIASFVFVISTLIVKRGLLLGGSGRSCYFPGSIPGSGAYGKETQIFGPITACCKKILEI